MAVLAPPAGTMRTPLRVEEFTEVRVPGGTITRSWTADPIKWPAHVRMLQGQELFEAQQIKGNATHEVTGRYRAGLDRKQRFVKPDGMVLNIVSINNVEERNITHTIRCKEVV